MVSNDDVQFTVDRPSLMPIMWNSDLYPPASPWEYHVPTGKRWIIKEISMIRQISGGMVLELFDSTIPMPHYTTLVEETGLFARYTPKTKFAMPEDWGISVEFSGVGAVKSAILYEQENVY